MRGQQRALRGRAGPTSAVRGGPPHRRPPTLLGVRRLARLGPHRDVLALRRRTVALERRRVSEIASPYSIIAKFHYTDTDTGPTRTRHGQSPRTLSGTS